MTLCETLISGAAATSNTSATDNMEHFQQWIGQIERFQQIQCSALPMDWTGHGLTILLANIHTNGILHCEEMLGVFIRASHLPKILIDAFRGFETQSGGQVNLPSSSPLIPPPTPLPPPKDAPHETKGGQEVPITEDDDDDV